MKTTEQIMKDIKKAQSKITDTSKIEKEFEHEVFRQTSKEDPNEKEKAFKKYKAAEQKYMEETKRNEDQKMIIEILKENYKNAFRQEYAEIICDIWNKYKGKPHGEKTGQKIRDELKAATGFHVYICNQYGDANITVQNIYNGEKKMPLQNITFYPAYKTNEKQPATDNNNKICEIIAENLKVSYCGEYVENPAAQVKAIREAHEKALEAEKALEDAASIYNNLIRGNISRISIREGVKRWFL